MNELITMMFTFLSKYEDRKELEKDIEIQKTTGLLNDETAPYYKKFIEYIIPEKEKKTNNKKDR